MFGPEAGLIGIGAMSSEVFDRLVDEGTTWEGRTSRAACPARPPPTKGLAVSTNSKQLHDQFPIETLAWCATLDIMREKRQIQREQTRHMRESRLIRMLLVTAGTCALLWGTIASPLSCVSGQAGDDPAASTDDRYSSIIRAAAIGWAMICTTRCSRRITSTNATISPTGRICRLTPDVLIRWGQHPVRTQT